MQTVGEQFLTRKPTNKISTTKVGNVTRDPSPPMLPVPMPRTKKSEMAIKEMKEEIVDMAERLRLKNLPQILQMR